MAVIDDAVSLAANATDAVRRFCFHSLDSISDFGLDFGLLASIFQCCIAVILFGVGVNLISIDVYRFVRWFYPLTEDDRKLHELDLELANIREQMAKLSPTNDFARYFKLDRVHNGLMDRRTKLSRSVTQNAIVSSVRSTILFKVVCVVSSLLIYSFFATELVVIRINRRVFYPFNFVLSLPSVFDSSEKVSEEIDVSWYNLLLMALLVRKVWIRNRVESQKKLV